MCLRNLLWPVLCEWKWNTSLLGERFENESAPRESLPTILAARMSQPGSQSEGNNRVSVNPWWTYNTSNRWTRNKPLLFQATEILDLFVNEAKLACTDWHIVFTGRCFLETTQSLIFRNSEENVPLSSSPARLSFSIIFSDYWHYLCQWGQYLWIQLLWDWLLEFILNDWVL